MTIMVDGIAPDVPAIHARYPSNPVACYVNGAYAWSLGQEHLFARKVRVSVESGQPTAAKKARVIDKENGAATAADVPPFLRVRAAVCAAAGEPNDGTVYCSLSAVPDVLGAFDPNHATPPGAVVPRWWLAWYWQRPGHPTAAQVLAELHRLTGVDLPPERLWACQYASYAQWDLSVVYGPEDFSR